MGFLNRIGGEIDQLLYKEANKSFFIVEKIKKYRSAQLWSKSIDAIIFFMRKRPHKSGKPHYA